MSRRFLPYFCAMFLGAFNDNFFKSAIVILITYRLADAAGVSAGGPVAAAAGVFILPFVILSPLAGQVADKYERSRLIRVVKAAEIVIMALGGAAFHIGSITLLMIVLFLMGAQSSFFGPLKYSVIPLLVRGDELLRANGLVESGTFLATLLGTIFGGMFVLHDGGLLLSAVAVVAVAAAGWLASRAVPPLGARDPGLRVNFDPISVAARMFRVAASSRRVITAMLGVSWFYFVGAAYLSQFPLYAKDILGADERVATFFLGVFSVGIGVGSAACVKLLDGRVTGRWATPAAIGIALCGAAMRIVGGVPAVPGAPLISVGEFLSSPANIAFSACLFAISFFGGIFVVPLYSLIQRESGEERLVAVTAALNITDSTFMVASSAMIALMLRASFTIQDVIVAVSVLTAVVGILLRPLARE